MRAKCLTLAVAIGLACGCSDNVADHNKNLQPINPDAMKNLKSAGASGPSGPAVGKASAPP